MSELEQKFNRSFEFVIISEGGTNNDPVDRGGLTNFGISQKQYPDLDIKSLTIKDAKDIYYSDYWMKSKCQMMSADLATVVFDSAVNCGQPSAAIWIQNACNSLGSTLKTDGIIGSHTALEIIKHRPHKLLALVISSRLRRYTWLIQEYPEQKKFIIGWMNRVAHLLDYISINSIYLF